MRRDGRIGGYRQGLPKGAFGFGEAGAKVEENQTTNQRAHATSFQLGFLVYSKSVSAFCSTSTQRLFYDASLII